MEIITKKHLMVFSGTAHPDLSEEIAQYLGIPLSPCEIRRFASSEVYVRPEDSVRGADVFVIQTHADPVNESIMEQLIMIDAMKRASAKRITAVIPYYGYSRQDKKTLSREPISAKLVADLLSTAGADRVVSVDLHSGQIQGYFDFPFDHLTCLITVLWRCDIDGTLATQINRANCCKQSEEQCVPSHLSGIG